MFRSVITNSVLSILFHATASHNILPAVIEGLVYSIIASLKEMFLRPPSLGLNM